VAGKLAMVVHYASASQRRGSMRREHRNKLAKPSWRMSGNIVDVWDLGGGEELLKYSELIMGEGEGVSSLGGDDER